MKLQKKFCELCDEIYVGFYLQGCEVDPLTMEEVCLSYRLCSCAEL